MIPRLIRTLVLYLPALLSWFASDTPVASYWIAWSGSFFILYFSMTGRALPLPRDRTTSEQFMRPIILSQIIFAVYHALSSVFLFLDSFGFFFFMRDTQIQPTEEFLMRFAEAQRYYVLAHASFVSGILVYMRYKKPRWRLATRHLSDLFLRITIAMTLLTIFFKLVPGGDQFIVRWAALASMSSLLSLALAIIEKRAKTLWPNLVIFALNFGYSFLSGWKETSLVMLVCLGAFLFPYYKKRVLIAGAVALLSWMLIVPFYTSIFREKAWTEKADARQSFQAAYSSTKSASRTDLLGSTWDFLTGRLSEIGMFIQFMENVPSTRPYYGTEFMAQAFESLVPRMFWPNKPSIEAMVMKRVYENNVVSEEMEVSAKPSYIADAYMSGGWLWIFLSCYFLGACASILSRKLEYWFGGYIGGTACVYNSIFQIMWRGNSFEFLLNSILWSFVICYALFYVARHFKVLKRETPS